MAATWVQLAAEGGNVIFNSVTASFSGSFSGSVDGTASTAINADTASVAPRYTLTSSFNTFSSSYVNASASFNTRINQVTNATGGFVTTQSFQAFTQSMQSFTSSINTQIGIISASYATTASNLFRGDQTISGSITITDTITAQRLVVQTVSSSVIYSSGSNVFGNSLSDTQRMSGSVTISGSLTVNGSQAILTNQTSSMHVLLADTASVAPNYTLTSSFNTLSSSISTDSGSFNSRITTNSASFSTFSGSYSTDSGSFDSRIRNLSSSVSTDSSSFNSRINTNSASFSTFSGSYVSDSASFNTRSNNNSSSVALLSSSFITTSASYTAFSASYNSGSFSGSFTGSFRGDGGALTNISASSIVGLQLNQIASGSATASISPITGLSVNIKTSISGTLAVSQSINAYNINAGTPTSNAWQSNLSGSYFNNFTSQTDVSEILRFIAGLLSSSAPDASPNTRTYSTYTAAAQNTTTGTVTAGSIPQSSSNTTLLYLNSKGFANTGSTIFNGISTIYTSTSYGYTYTSVAAGTTIVTSSADAQLFGLGILSSGTPTTFSVSGSTIFRFKDNSAKTDVATSSSQQIITQTGAGTTSGVTLAKINTANPAVIPAAYQDGKFASVFGPSLYNGGAAAVSSSGYYHISTSIAIASGSSAYTTPINSAAEIFYAPLTTISTNVPANTIAATSVSASLTAVSRSLSGAPYLSGSTYIVSSSVTGLFNPLYYASTNLSYQSLSGTGMTQTSGVTTVSTAGGTIQTANAVYDTTGTTLRSTSTIPYETDIVKTNALYTFGAANITNVGQTTNSPTTFTVTTNATNKNSSASTYNTQTFPYHVAGTFGQTAASGSLAYFTRTQGADSSTALIESFTGENYRYQLTDTVLTFSASAWNTAFVLNQLSGSDLQVKPGYLVKPGGTYGYWIGDPDATKTYKYYVRKFTTSGTKTSMTLNLGQTLIDWQTATTNTVSALILFESSNSNIYTPARFYDPTKTLSNFVANINANTNGQNPFGSTIALYGNTGGSVASTTYTIPIRNADGMFLNATYTNIYVLVRYNGDPTPITSITTTFS